MIKVMRLIQMARKWRKATATERRRISLSTSTNSSSSSSSSSSVAEKGHFIVYSTDNRRFMVPLKYLHCDIFRELFKMSEEEFGLPGNGPITLPCDAVFMDYVLLMMKLNQKHRLSKDLETALLMSLAPCSTTTTTSRYCSSSSSFESSTSHQSRQVGEKIFMIRQQLLLQGF